MKRQEDEIISEYGKRERLRDAAHELAEALQVILPIYCVLLRSVGADPNRCGSVQAARAALAKAGLR